MKRSVAIAFAAGIALLALGACAAGSGESQHAAQAGALSQLLLGFWHGLIAPVALIVEVVNAFAPHLLPWTMHLYESKGTGVIYDVGFYLGLAGSPTLVFSRRSRRV
jgi:hypothetical protein